MRYFFYLMLLFGICSFLFGCSPSSFHVPKYEKIADQLTAKIGKKLKEQKSLALIGIGGRMMGDIQLMAMSFQLFHEVELNEARELIVYVINEYLSAINNSQEIRPYLHEYPFTAKNVEIRIWIYEPDGHNPPLDKIDHISAIDGVLTYYLDRPETYSREIVCEESYEEAVKILKAENYQNHT